MTYPDIIRKFIFEQLPKVEIPPEIRFEAISKEIFGTKQRRNGPMPSPECQVAIREILRNDNQIEFFVPWGCRKQTDDQNLDILEFCALKQLVCLEHTLAKYGKKCHFTFRLEDLSDEFLFDGIKQIGEYRNTFKNLTHFMLDNAKILSESQFVRNEDFKFDAKEYTTVFLKYLKNQIPVDALHEIGWKGNIPQEQRNYYLDAYKIFYPEGDPLIVMAKYFSTVLTRVKLGITCEPKTPHIKIYFGNPVPGNPIIDRKIYYRSIPERFSHQHRAPWIGKGYLVINDDNDCCPKSAGVGEELNLIHSTIDVGRATIQADYLLG